MNTIKINNLSVEYGKLKALQNISVSFDGGKLIGVIGPNGSGKSTFLKSLVELIPNNGEISFHGEKFSNVRNEIAYVPQRESVDWDFPISVYEVVGMGLLQAKKWWKSNVKANQSKIEKAIEVVGLKGLEKRRISELSGGQQQRVFIARALVQNANYYLLDEPFVGVDIQTQQVLLELFNQLKKEGKTIVMVHHDLSDAAKHFDEILLLNSYQVAYGKTDEVLTVEVMKKVYPNLLVF